MAYLITFECNLCDACVAECPNEAITAGPDIYLIDPFKCTECVGWFDEAQCAAVCPMDCCDTDPERQESEEILVGRARELTPEEDIGDEYPSHFQA